MYAMILAAGMGTRMKPLTNDMPKPLLKVHGKPLLQYHIEALVAASVTRIVINTGIMGDMIEKYFGSGEAFNVNITYSAEGDNPLKTGGGIKNALHHLGSVPFILVNGDIWTDYNLSQLPDTVNGLAHLVMVDNPTHHPQGDFYLHGQRLRESGDPKLTYSGIGVFSHTLFANRPAKVFELGPLLRSAIQQDRVSGEYYPGVWYDIGTPERLEMIDNT